MTNSDTIEQSLCIVDITRISSNMQNNNILTTTELDSICNFLINNNNESKSEELGYILFEYLRNKPNNNRTFLSYLSQKDSSQKDMLLTSLIQIMCIDIGEENYTFDAFVKDFNIFKDSHSAKKAFYNCMGNQ